MARPIAGINDYPYGICGYIVDGAFLRDGTKIKTVRIFKQRSDVMFDLIDPKTDTVYQKVLITGVDTRGEILDYSKTNDELVNEIPKNTFFVRGFNEIRTREGFVVRFLLNKVILSTGKPLYDMYTPTCDIPLPTIDNIIISPVRVNDTVVRGTLTSNSGPIDPTGMVVTLTLPDGTQYQTTVDADGKFVFDPVVINIPGTATVTVTSPNYEEATSTFTVLDDDMDSDYVTSISLSGSDFVPVGDGSYVASIPETLHGRGTKVVVQIQNSSGIDAVQFSGVDVDDDGNITITQNTQEATRVVIIGETLETTPFSSDLTWTANGDGTVSSTVTQATHGKRNISFTTYDGTSMVTVDAQIDDDDNLTFTTTDSFSGSVVITGKE